MVIKMARKLVCGVGVNDADYQISSKLNGKQVICKVYQTWLNMLNRCYSEKHHKKHPTYIGCSVYEEWLRFSNFRAWMIQQDWYGKHLDKDLLLKGNKVYSPESCLFVSSEVNNFIIENNANRGDFMIGVSLHKKTGKFTAACKSSAENKNIYLGLFDTEISAHLAWKSKKYELACKLAKLQTDERVAKSLIERYS